MAFMNVMTRNKLKIVIAEAYKLKKKEGKVNSTVQNLNSKILRAKTKLEVVSAVKEKARSIVRSLSHTLEKLKIKIKEAKQENELIGGDVRRRSGEGRGEGLENVAVAVAMGDVQPHRTCGGEGARRTTKVRGRGDGRGEGPEAVAVAEKVVVMVAMGEAQQRGGYG
ncbi:hypothetical protein Fmac_021165 [Flemingia macrophylla]|uniref:Uncharacterized protein n=1 Tax=Flemingia macrophylla TaxID=520843 RepID=A0ABD1LWK7_9FABA